MIFSNYREFLGGVRRSPKGFSTLFPTGSFLSRELGRLGEISSKKAILELGSGSGAITKNLVTNLSPGSSFCGIEIDAPLAQWLNDKFPAHQFQAGSAADISTIYPNKKFDLIVASLPWTLFDRNLQMKIISEIEKVLTTDGSFVFFITKHVDQTQASQDLKDILNDKKFQIESTTSVWLNLPPANIYLSKKGKVE